MVIDAHLHVWSKSHAYAKGKEPPPELGDDVASAEALKKSMDENGIDGALIVQPINYEYDHSYVASMLKVEPERFRGMALANPSSADGAAAAAQLRSACETAPGQWVGVRFNPYLWKPAAQEGEWMADEAGLALLEKCHDLDLPIGVMAFGGLRPLVPSLVKLLEHPKTVPIVIDHWGFCRDAPGEKPSEKLGFDQTAFDTLLDLGRKYPRLYVKLSAMFRVAATDAPHEDLKPRFDALLAAFGPDRLMWGSDFPFVQLQTGGQAGSLDAIRRFAKDLPKPQQAAILGGTAQKLFKFKSATAGA